MKFQLNHKALLLFIILSGSPQISAQPKTSLSFHMGTLNPHNHSGPDDLTIKGATYYVEDNQLIFELFIEDDDIILENGNLKTDHIEFWFSAFDKNSRLVRFENRKYFDNIQDYPDGSALFGTWYEFEPERAISRDSLIAEARSALHGKMHYYQDVPDSVIYSSKVSMRWDFTGIAHWGVYPDTVIFYDREFYEQSSAPGPFTDITPLFHQTSGGYSVKVKLNPEHLGFFKQNSIKTLRANVVIFDQDANGYSLHSLSENYEWGDVEGFQNLVLNESLFIEMSQHYADFETNPHTGSMLYEYSNGKWYFIKELYKTLSWWDVLYDAYWVNINLSKKEIKVGDHEAHLYSYGYDSENPSPAYYHFPRQNTWLLIQQDGDYHEIYDSLETIEFADGQMGFFMTNSYMQSPWGQGACGACTHYVTTLYRIEDKAIKPILETDVNDGNMVCNWRSNLDIPQAWVPRLYESQWDVSSNRLTIPVYYHDYIEPPDTVVIGWDKDWKPILLSEPLPEVEED